MSKTNIKDKKTETLTAEKPKGVKSETLKTQSDVQSAKATSETSKGTPFEDSKIKNQTQSDVQSAKATSETSKGTPFEDPKIKNPKAEDSIKNPKAEDSKIQLNGLFAFKMSMTSFYEDGKRIPVTALQYKPWKVAQIKTKSKEGYSAIQLACQAQKNKRCSKALIQHLKPAGFKEGARYVKEIRQDIPEGLKVGQDLSIESLKKGDRVQLVSRSKGLGFTGVIKRWNFKGGPSSHGSKSHRRIGSIGQHTEPARVMPGRKMPGQCGFQKQSQFVKIVDVLTKEQMIFVKGSVPGARNTLVSLLKK